MLTETLINTLERNADALRYLGETCEDNGLEHILNRIAMELADAADELQGNPLEDEDNLKKVEDDVCPGHQPCDRTSIASWRESAAYIIREAAGRTPEDTRGKPRK